MPVAVTIGSIRNGRGERMKVRVLGTGCPKCKKLYEEAGKAIAASGVNAELEKVEKINEIIQYGVMATPGLVIDNDVKASGRVPASSEIESWIKAAAEKTE
jgi:small redox-active disulfide protein 2